MNRIHIFILNILIENQTDTKKRRPQSTFMSIMVTQEGFEPPTL